MKKLFYIILTAIFFLACGKGEDSDITGGGASSDESFSNINITRNSSTLNSGSSEINLGTVRTGEEGSSAEIKISNNGNINLSVTEIQITGADPNDFSTDFDSETEIAPDESETVTIYFSPATTTIGNRNAELRIRHDDENSENPYTILLTGSVTTTVSDIWVIDNNSNLVKNGLSESNFGTINEGDTTAYRTFTIKNSGSANLNINSINISGSQFDLDTSSTASSLAPDNSTTSFQVRFAPSTSGFFSETITINSNDPDEPNFSFTVSGTALDTGSVMTPRIMLKVDNSGVTGGSTINFGSLRVNPANSPSSETKTITIYNVGSAPLNLSSINTITGDYTRTSPGSTTIATGGSTSFTITYNPDDILAPTAHTRTLIIANDDPLNSSFTLNLTGLAYDPVMQTISSGTNMGNNASQQTANPTTSSEIVTISNTGNYDLVIQNITATGDTAHFSDTRSGAIGTIAAGGN
ncbi:MAG TPA: choice-of-anchor D domain-containing protein, partial [Spirochaetota bacterium]|nr:choice-of-anchor D domain-containing protein [Spirochaetota bacterium]